ncbi:MAG: histidine kinase [Bacteroidia bacterium]|nr:histidine kinase [Bacteroidia bacterium]
MAEAKPTILYVDDERHNLVAFKASFRRFFKVLIAQSGEEALDILASEEVSVIISDQRMPGMTGVELFTKIQEIYPLPIRMVLTAYSDVADIIDAINKGKVYYYVTKPWKFEDLKVLIDNALEAFRLKSENQSLTVEKQMLELEAAQQEKEIIIAQFETLKNQVNPHFLFNSLNVLSSLVHEDPDLAESFISKLTRIYRYVLDLKEETLVSLEKELNFANSYFFLQQIRFGNNLQLYIEVPEIKKQNMLPPLSLQLLMENAVKHNIISKDKPLKIELFLDGEELVVKNNFQVRTEKEHSTGIGLSNLRERYRLLTDRKPSFEREGESYVARIPLLSPNGSY